MLIEGTTRQVPSTPSPNIWGCLSAAQLYTHFVQNINLSAQIRFEATVYQLQMKASELKCNVFSYKYSVVEFY